jgi:hypothetical protein
MHSHVVALPHVTVGRSLRLTKVTIPDRLVVGDDADAEARRFRRTANSVCRITQPMVDALGRWGYPGAGTGSDHVREKDGLWAVLLWRDIVAARGESVGDILKDHWRTYGRDYCTRHDYEAIDTAVGDRLMAALRTGLPALPGRNFAGLTVSEADDFAYRDPTDGSVSAVRRVAGQRPSEVQIPHPAPEHSDMAAGYLAEAATLWQRECRQLHPVLP